MFLVKLNIIHVVVVHFYIKYVLMKNYAYTLCGETFMPEIL
jgi:hypothetical protein